MHLRKQVSDFCSTCREFQKKNPINLVL